MSKKVHLEQFSCFICLSLGRKTGVKDFLVFSLVSQPKKNFYLPATKSDEPVSFIFKNSLTVLRH